MTSMSDGVDDAWPVPEVQTGEAARAKFEKMRRRLVDQQFETGDEDTRKISRRPSLLRALIEDITKAALEHAVGTGAPLDQFEWELTTPGIAVVDKLCDGLSDNFRDTPAAQRLNFWKHDPKFIHLIIEGRTPRIRREFIEEAATEYLALPYRAPVVERIVIDVLIAAEVYAFGAEIRGPSGLPWWFPFRPRMHVIPAFLLNQFFNGLILLGPAILIGQYGGSVIGQVPAGWIAALLTALFALGLVLAAFRLPFAWRNQSKARREAEKLFSAMTAAYLAIDATSAVSVRHLKGAVDKAADLGVVWPPSLFAVLDDNIVRGGRL